MMDRMTTILWSTVLAVLVLTGAAQANLLVYEPFDYDAGSDINTPLEGGDGFAEAWSPGQQGGIPTIYDETAETVINNNSGGELTWNGVVDNVPTLPSVGSRFIASGPSPPDNSDRLTAQRVLSQSAGALAGDDNVLWASVIWHMEGSNYGRQVGFTLGTDGLANRSTTCDTSGNFGAGIGDAIGVGGAFNSGQVTPVVFDDGAIAVRTTEGAATVSYTKDNLLVLKYEFIDGASLDRVYAYRFTESDTLSETDFDTNAVFAEYAIDQDTLNILSFSQSARGTSAIDEIRLGDTFLDVISGTSVAPPEADGDANGDGVVDAADYILVKQNMGLPVGVAGEDGDFNETGTVDWDDLQTLITGMAGDSGGSVPEPVSLLIMAAGLPALLRRRRPVTA